ncbi:MAG: hypothetical protein FWG66_14810 [Spirochaetes bacterium]|nr:hypothetical protein [Spirochaetota bacterium]
MKGTSKIFGVIAVAVAVSLGSCASFIRQEGTVYRLDGEYGGAFPRITDLPAKDFEPVQLVFTENVVFPSVQGGGEVFTFHQLLREAHAVGAHAIMNVQIDRVETTRTVDGREEVVSIRYFGSALAIRYTEPVFDIHGNVIFAGAPPLPGVFPVPEQDPADIAALVPPDTELEAAELEALADVAADVAAPRLPLSIGAGAFFTSDFGGGGTGGSTLSTGTAGTTVLR